MTCPQGTSDLLSLQTSSCHRRTSSFFFFKINLFIYLWLCWVFVAALGLPLVVASGATLRCGAWAYCGGFSCWGARALGAQASVVVTRGLQ